MQQKEGIPMKKLVSVLLLLCLSLSLLTGCTDNVVENVISTTEPSNAPAANHETPVDVPADPAPKEPEPLVEEPKAEEPTIEELVAESPTEVPYEPIEINIAMLKGSTGMGAAKLMADAAEGLTANSYHFSLSADAADVMAKVISGEYDIAALPTNSAAVAFNKSQGEVQMLAINTLGVLYLMQKTGVDGSPIQSFEQLRGQTIVAFGQGANPEYVLNHLLTMNGLEPGTDVIIDWKATVDEVLSAVVVGDYDFVMLPEPNVSVANSKNPDYTICMDLTREWDEISDGSLVMGSIVVTKSFAEAYPAAVEKFLEEYAASIEFVTTDATAPAVIAAQEIVPAEGVAKKALPNCHIVCITGADMQPTVEAYYQMLFEANPKAVGGSVPTADFYYGN